jgi:hypothetical protein
VIPVWFTCIVLSGYFPLQGLIRISMTPSDMGEACSLRLNVEVLYHRVHMRFTVIFNYGYLVVENDDTKNG